MTFIYALEGPGKVTSPEALPSIGLCINQRAQTREHGHYAVLRNCYIQQQATDWMVQPPKLHGLDT
jgi:hypothetical protein